MSDPLDLNPIRRRVDAANNPPPSVTEAEVNLMRALVAQDAEVLIAEVERLRDATTEAVNDALISAQRIWANERRHLETQRDEARVQREEYGRENEDLRDWLANSEESNRMMQDRLQRLIQGNAALRNELDECRDRGMAVVAELRSRGWTGEVEEL